MEPTSSDRSRVLADAVIRTLACDNRRIEQCQLSEDFKVLENSRCA
jgi:hypothetical protein